MKKLTLLLALSLFSTQGLAVPSIFSCEVKRDLSIFEDSISDVKRVDSFIFKDEIDKLVFSKDKDKRPNIVLDDELTITSSQRNSDTELFLSGWVGSTIIPFAFQYFLKKDYGYLDIAYSRTGNARVMIARCVAF